MALKKKLSMLTLTLNNTLLLLLAMPIVACSHIKVLRSEVKLENYNKELSGAKLLDGRKVSVKDVTFCIRFNYKLLGGYEGKIVLMIPIIYKDKRNSIPKQSMFLKRLRYNVCFHVFICMEDWRIDFRDSDLSCFGCEQSI